MPRREAGPDVSLSSAIFLDTRAPLDGTQHARL